MAQCVTCGASIKPGATRCLKCGTMVESAAPPPPQAPSQSQTQPEQPAQNPSSMQYAQQPQVIYVQQPQQAPVHQSTKSRVTAAVLAILLGSFGFHKFYLGKIWQGLLYLIFCWTWIPGIIGLIEGIYYLTLNENDFSKKYG